MSTETFFYIIGSALVVGALIIAFLGLRSDSFPSRNAMRLGVPLFALLVAVAMVGAVRAAESEQEHRENEEAALAEEEATQEADASQDTEGAGEAVAPDGTGDNAEGEPNTGTPPTAAGDATAGETVFLSNGCGSCHTLQVLGTDAQGQIGPNLDEALVDEDPTFIETSIVDPGAEVEEGYPDGTMPQDYGTELTPTEIQDLVAFLSESTSEPASGTQQAGSGSKESGKKPSGGKSDSGN